MTPTPVTRPINKQFARIAYLLFVAAGLFFLFRKEYGNSTMFLGLAFVFDPFNPDQAFNLRPKYQRLVLIAHLLITFTALGLSIF